MGAFLRWFLFLNLIIVGGFLAWLYGFVGEVWEVDITRITLIILAVFVYFSVWCGIKTFKLCCLGKAISVKEQERFSKIDRTSEYGWFAASILMGLGMTGTVIGFILILSNFETIDVSKTQTIQAMVMSLGRNLGVALYTTLLGLVFSILLRIQYFNLDQLIKRLKND